MGGRARVLRDKGEPPPATAPLPAPRGIPGKAHPCFLLLMAGESRQSDARAPPLLCRLGLCCCGFEFPSLEGVKLPGKGARCDGGVQGMRGGRAPRQTRAALVAKTGLYWGWGGSVLPNVSCLPPTYIYLYTENSRCACVCIYGVCVCVYIFICCIYKDIHIHRFVLIT